MVGRLDGSSIGEGLLHGSPWWISMKRQFQFVVPTIDCNNGKWMYNAVYHFSGVGLTLNTFRRDRLLGTSLKWRSVLSLQHSLFLLSETVTDGHKYMGEGL